MVEQVINQSLEDFRERFLKEAEYILDLEDLDNSEKKILQKYVDNERLTEDEEDKFFKILDEFRKAKEKIKPKETFENQIDKFKEDVSRMENTIGSVGVRIDTVEDNVDAVNSKICTDFYKTSTIKSPSCRAIADYIDTVLADLDGSEVSF